jgi:uncharacterized protein (DUF4415 family)
MSPKNHYKDPTAIYPVCGLKDILTAKVTPNRREVTCKKCLSKLSTETAEKRPPGRPSEGKQKTSVSFDPDIWELIKDLGWRQRSPLVNQILRDNIERYL